MMAKKYPYYYFEKVPEETSSRGHVWAVRVEHADGGTYRIAACVSQSTVRLIVEALNTPKLNQGAGA